ncbi:hypothetical protein FACS1894217_02000 [Clostridia bacterium]|nr:hypothetical protein FACS1894217_02000 [Clostridia bacterium]
MSDELQTMQLIDLPATTGVSPPAVLSQVGDKNTQIAHAENVVIQKSFNFIANGGITKKSGSLTQSMSWQPSNEYYNLIVSGSDEHMEKALAVGSLLIQKDRVLMGCTEETKARFERLDDVAIEQIKLFPSIIASENHNYGRTDEEHQAFFGRITDIGCEDNGIRLYLQTIYPISQQRLNEIEYDLALQYSSSFNEFNRTHWAIKRVNLLDVLTASGLKPF